MRLKKISKQDIKELLRESVREYKIYLPMENRENDTLFAFLPEQKNELEKALDKVNLKDEWVIISPKDVLFPQLETMFRFDRDNIQEEVETSKKLIFGIKPCDLKGMLFVDEFFKRNLEDIYYLSRAKDRLIVTIGCLKPPRPKACFCTSAETGPFIKDGFDLQLVDTGDGYIVEIGSDKGEAFVNSHSRLFKDIAKNDEDKLAGIKSEAANAVNVKVDFKKALEIMKNEKDFEENYKRISERCIYCGACLYTCPTCTCFNVFDDVKDGKGTRKRNWDTCVFEGYTREASGHNPRKEKKLRTARRYEHKLRYDYSVTGMSGCVACGRCLSSCPVEIGISRFIDEITENKKVI